APGDLNAVVAEAARLAHGPAEANGIRVALDLDATLPAVAMARAALVQVFRNLTNNAVQAMPDGGVLRLATHFDPARRLAEVSVADTGTGLSAEMQSHV